MDSYELLQYAADTLDRLRVPYFVTGSMATSMHGESRFTNDVDIVADFKTAHTGLLYSAFPGPDFYCSRPAIEEAIRQRTQFNIIHPTSGLKIDFMVPDDSDFNRSRLSRSQMIATSAAGRQARFASPEDAILKKLEYFKEGGSEKHVRDIRGVLMIQGDALDFSYLDKWAEQLDVVEEWEKILKADSK